MPSIPPMPSNESERVLSLLNLDIDYTEVQESLKELTKLAAKVAGTSISLVNLIDTLTQWTVSNYGLELQQMAREDSVCQYTILKENSFEVKDLTADERFNDKSYVTGPPAVKYYLGVPLQTGDGYNIGALCVLDQVGKEITPEKIELLKIIADEIVSRLTAYHVIQQLRSRVKEARETQRKVAHDIRGPLGGIISLAEIISSQGNQNQMDQVLEFIGLIQKSGTSLLDLANEILTSEKKTDDRKDPTAEPNDHLFNLVALKEKLEHLYSPQALPKNIDFTVTINGRNGLAPLSKNKLLQIIGNLISNAIKFTPAKGKVGVELDLSVSNGKKILAITVRDSGVGISQDAINIILQGNADSTSGTDGEKGYGFGLSLVRYLVEGMGGRMQVSSVLQEGTVFEVQLPQI
ncbi:MAG: GAF domain-containing sensor histidine kinase [Bacteroidota bacterium]